MTDNKKNLGRAALFLATLIWGISFVLMDLTLENISTMYILAVRFCGAAVILLIVGFKELKKLDKRTLGGSVLMGVVLLAAYAFQTYGLKLTTPGKNAFLTSVYTIVVPFIYWLIIKKRPDRYNISAAVLCLCGVGLISLDGNLRVGLGDGLTLVCGLLYAVHIVLCGAIVENRSPVLVSMLQFAVAGILAAVCAFLFEPFPVHVPVRTIWALGFMTVMSTALCLSLQVFGQKHTPTSQASVIMAFEAVFGAAASVLMTGELLSFKLFCGFLLTFLAVIVSETKLDFLKRKKKVEALNEEL